MRRGIRRGGMAAVLVAFVPATAGASAFQILEQSPSRLGKAFAGSASQPADASTVFFNPAAMARLEERQLTLGGNLIAVDASFDDQGSTAGSGTAFERPLPGEEGRTDLPGVVPNLYYLQPLSEDWTAGFGINAPFGLASEYDDDWVGRYHGTESELQTINLNATFAYAVTEAVSLGFGLSYQRADTRLESAVDSFNACREAGGSAATCAAAHGGPGNPNSDSSSTTEGNDSDVIADLSLHWQATERTAFGVTYRQGADYTLEGEADFDVSTSCAQDPFCSGALNALEGDIEGEAALPDTVTLSASHAFNDRWSLHGDIAWTGWSELQSIAIDNTETGETVNTLELNYDDTIRTALGVTWEPRGAWTWRAGVAYDEAPQTDPEFVTPRIPDEDRTWASVGFNYAVASNISIDVGYAHVFTDEIDINNTEQGNTLTGTFDATIDIFGIQGNWRF
jgi:long-chain fatty acid transport protein